MNRLLRVLLPALLAAFLIGCGGDREKGTMKDRDRPRAGDKTAPETKEKQPGPKEGKPKDGTAPASDKK